ncbi:hypothetical protein AQUCO_00700475v1 [Aquilegia coerulea]|uniref:Cytochrome P450 n=1 Tax=Aquilegia coerulea TaxID=218851 RepID=A0A2G5EK57_AQUCA|nr:hypothetical protein AQUCO_00700475v1 [Aquilegia coerulea]
MDFVHQFLTSTPIMVSLLAFLISLCFLIRWLKRPKSSSTSMEAPEAPGAWPIVGHLRVLGGERNLPHQVLGAMADKCGPIFTVRIGMRCALVVCKWEVAKECFTTNDKSFASRPNTSAAKIMGYDYAMMGFAPYGNYWRELRKLIMFELLSGSRLESLKYIQDSEVHMCINELYQKWVIHDKARGPVAVEMKQWFGDLTQNVILRMMTGKRYSVATSASDETESRRVQSGMRDFLRLLGIFIVEDAIPILEWFDLQGYKKEMKNTAKDLDVLYQGWYEEHQRKKLSGEDKGKKSFIDIMTTMLEEEKIADYDNHTITKATVLSVLSGGDTTNLTLTWTLSLLLNNKQIMKKAQDELDVHVGRDRGVKESDIKNLVFLQAIVKEVLRLYPAAPLSGPRVATEDCTVAGYHVPKGRRLIVNTWKIHRDPSVWSDPLEFCPERFLTTHVDMDVKGTQNYELIPFGAGRRACPGISFALQLVPLALACLLHAFDLTTKTGMQVDMTESAGLTNVKATPLQVVITPRLRPELYGRGW